MNHESAAVSNYCMSKYLIFWMLVFSEGYSHFLNFSQHFNNIYTYIYIYIYIYGPVLQ